MDKITVGNVAQRILLECELKGQLSDGHWENSTPRDHWQRPCGAEVVVAEVGSPTGLSWWPSKTYNFDNKMLRECVGDRMIYAVKFFQAFPNISMDDHWSFDLSDGWPTATGAYWDKKRALVLSATGCADYAAIMEKVNAIVYTEKNLRADLKALGAVFKQRSI